MTEGGNAVEVAVRRTSRAVAGGALIVMLSSCQTAPAPGGSHPGRASSSPAPAGFVVPGDYVSTTTTTQARFLGALKNATKPPDGQGVLVGPHSVFQFDGFASTTRIDAAASRALGLRRPISAATGYELVLAHEPSTVTYSAALPESGTAAFYATAAPTLEVARHPRSVPCCGNTLVVSVPTGAPVALQMNDGGRPQSLNLRTGRRERNAIALYYPVRADLTGNEIASTGPHMMGAVYHLAHHAGDIDVHVWAGNGDGAYLEPYVGTRKWAPAGRAWLIVSLDMDASGYGFAADVRRSFTLVLPGGAALTGTTLSGRRTVVIKPGAGPEDWVGMSLLFKVPATLRSCTLVVSPRGRFNALGVPVSVASIRPDRGSRIRIELTPQTGG